MDWSQPNKIILVWWPFWFNRNWASEYTVFKGYSDSVSGFSVWGKNVISICKNKIGLSSLASTVDEVNLFLHSVFVLSLNVSIEAHLCFYHGIGRTVSCRTSKSLYGGWGIKELVYAISHFHFTFFTTFSCWNRGWPFQNLLLVSRPLRACINLNGHIFNQSQFSNHVFSAHIILSCVWPLKSRTFIIDDFDICAL